MPERPLDSADRAPVGAAGESAAGTAPQVEVLPDSPPLAIARVARVVLRFHAAVSPSRAVLFAGDLSATQLRAFARGDPPQTLTERTRAASVWQTEGDTAVSLQPEAPLEPGARYTIALDVPTISLSLQVVRADALPMLARRWPPTGEAAASVDRIVYCGAQELPSLDRDEPFAPAGRPGRWTRGLGAPFEVPSCVQWSAEPSLPPSDWLVPPPLLTFDDGTAARLEPAVVQGSGGTAAAPGDCAAPELAIASGCADLQDDRAVIRSSADPVLWAFEGARQPRVAQPGQRFVVRRGVAQACLRWASIDRAATLISGEVAWPELPPRPHVVINEVYADPLGEEPAQEWIELFNDGANPVDLAGYRIEDAGGATVLPETVMPPAGYALLVNEAFALDDGLDAPVKAGVPLVRLHELGKGGLANAGEPLVLRDPQGQIASRFPAVRTRAGVSAVRVQPDALDDDPASFGPSPDASATPGAANGSPTEGAP